MNDVTKFGVPLFARFLVSDFFIVYSKRHSNKDEKKLEQSPGGLAAFFDFFSEQTKMAAKFRKAIAIGQMPKNTLLPTYLQNYNHTKTVTMSKYLYISCISIYLGYYLFCIVT